MSAVKQNPCDAHSIERAPAPIHHLARPAPDRATLARFVHALFKHANPDTFVSLRGFDQFDNSQPPQHIEAVAAGDLAYVVERAVYGAGIVGEARGVFAPPIATFTNSSRAGAADLADGLAISVDLDAGDTGAKLRELTAILGVPTVVVASGGEWPDPATGAVHDKLHLHWRLAAPARTPEDHARLCDARRWAAQLTGGDGTAGPIVHPLRWPGTLHLKADSRFARIVEQSDTEVTLAGALEALEAAGMAAGVALKARTNARTTVRVMVESDLPHNLASAEAVALAAAPAMGGLWHAEGFKLGARMCRLGLSEEMAVETLDRCWRPRGTGFTNPDRFRADVLGGYRDAFRAGQHGQETPDGLFSGVTPPAEETTVSSEATPAGAVLTETSEPLVLNPAAPMDSALALIERFHTEAGQRVLRFQGGTFYRWTGTHYAEATREELGSQIWQFLHTALRPVKDGLAAFNPTVARVTDVVGAAGAACQMPSRFRAPCWLDDAPRPAPGGIVACANGLLDLATGELLQTTPAFFTLNSLPFAYDPAALEPAAWLGFLNTLWPADPDSRAALQEIFGLLLTAETRFQKAFLLVGPKRSGKGTIARVLTSLLGQENVCGPTLGQLGQQFGSAPLIGKRLAIIADARLGGRADAEAVAERILNITGEDSQTIDRKFRDAWTGKLDARLLIISNELPRLADASGALASRLITLVLTESFYGREDQSLTDRLTEELPGILNWAIAGWRRLAAGGRFSPPQSSRDAQQELEDLGSPISVFVRDRCVVEMDAKARPEALYLAWRLWCAEQGRTQPGTLATFGRDLRAALPSVTRRQETVEGVRVPFYAGVGLPPAMPNVRPAPCG